MRVPVAKPKPVRSPKPREEREDTTIRKILRRGVEGPYKNKVTVSVDPKVGTFSAVASARLFSFTV